MSSDIVLPDTSLCAIVRDEKINPAGGIERFLHAHVPHVEEAVIVDTGSLDGTREILEEMQRVYPHIKVYDRKFQGFADARNYSLKKAESKYAIVLDADELLTSEKPTNDWAILKEEIGDNPEILYFKFAHIFFPKEAFICGEHNFRFFLNDSRISFFGACGEILTYKGGSPPRFKSSNSNAIIKHFLPRENGKILKQTEWYSGFWGRRIPSRSPSQVPKFNEWKEYNPKRKEYK